MSRQVAAPEVFCMSRQVAAPEVFCMSDLLVAAPLRLEALAIKAGGRKLRVQKTGMGPSARKWRSQSCVATGPLRWR